MKPTKLSRLVALFLISGWLVGVTGFIARVNFKLFLDIPMNLPIVTFSMALITLIWTLLIRKRISNPAADISPLQAARSAALALAGSRTGSLLAGGSVGLTINYAIAANSEANDLRVLYLSITAIGGLVLSMVSLWLERICSIPDRKDDQ